MKNSEKIAVVMELEIFLAKTSDDWEREVVAIPGRNFRFDYFSKKLKIAVEINGGQWVNGRHNRGGCGYESDLEKSNLAQSEGIVYLQYTYEMLAKEKYKKNIDKICKFAKNQ